MPELGKIILTIIFSIFLVFGIFLLVASIWVKEPYKQSVSLYKGDYYNQPKFKSVDPIKIYHEALSYAKTGLIDAALDKFKEVIKIIDASFSTSPTIKMLKRDTLYNCGLANEKLKNYNEAIEYYKESTQVDPNFYKSYCNIGSVYVKKGKFDLALENLNKALELNPRDDIAYFNRAIVNNHFGKNKLVVHDLEKFVNYAPPYHPYINEAKRTIEEIKSLKFDADEIANRLRSIL